MHMNYSTLLYLNCDTNWYVFHEDKINTTFDVATYHFTTIWYMLANFESFFEPYYLYVFVDSCIRGEMESLRSTSLTWVCQTMQDRLFGLGKISALDSNGNILLSR